MATKIKTSLYFPDFKLNITSNDRNIFDLVVKQFPQSWLKKKKYLSRLPRLTIQLTYHKTKYSNLPSFQTDHYEGGFALSYNQFIKEERIHIDVGPRTLTTTIDPKTNVITSFIATPPDIEKDLLFDLIFFQPLKHLLLLHGLYLFHSSLVAINNKGVLFSGKSGNGKSVLSLTLLKSGFNYLGDDEVILRPVDTHIECSSFLSRPKIKKNLLYLFPEFKDGLLPTLSRKDKVSININKLFPDRIRNKVKPYLLIFPQYVKSSDIKSRPIGRKSILNYLVREEFQHLRLWGRNISSTHFRVVTNLINQVKAYRLYYNDHNLNKIPGVISELLKSC